MNHRTIENKRNEKVEIRKKEGIKVNLRMKLKTPFDGNSNAVNDGRTQWPEKD